MQPIDVPADRGNREPSAAERFAARQVPDQPAGEPADELSPPSERLVSLRAVTDTLSMVLIVLGLSVGDVAAWLAGGRVPGLATLGGGLIMLGFLLTL
jgi:hypothetical protein